MKTKFLRIFLLLLLFVYACSNDDSTENPDPTPDIDSEIIETMSLQLNPSGYAPLTALLSIETSEEVGVEITVIGKQSAVSSITKRFAQRGTSFELNVLGLYANFENTVEVKILDGSSAILETQELKIETAPLIADLPQVSIDVPSNSSSPEFNFVNYFGFSQNFRPQRPFMFDQFGEIRWYLNFVTHPQLNNLFYDNGMTRLQNGNLLTGDGFTGNIHEIDMMGNLINTWSLQGNGFHHHVIEKPNGNLLVTINDVSKATVEDVIIEIDRATGEFSNTWDLNNSLDNGRRAWPTDLADLNFDWFHANAIEYSASDEEIIVSGRTQGIVKLNTQNEVSYILAPHKDWNTSGTGVDLTQFLLTPMDAQDQEIIDTDVLMGNTNHPDFEWSWYQHSPILMPNGNLMVFDNGDNRNYTNFGPYSRAVEYEIDEINKTIKQVWSYGKERGEETYARIVSKVSYVSENNSILFTPGSAVNNGSAAGKVVEVDYSSKEVIFEATIVPPSSVFNISFHNVLRMSLYD
ncbi:aryl-sulfate sulfotransferase [Croceitalea rosinachiae]|uniref:Aryl-sulfate sulfotransferase n=1 Tax=Croceitalea rosinachiae TaxID=3075596 RepID=A0ABU3A783_9FLAO|nr:aryl-sulfate sulfotransferase [Croceitalea sp. F388]MDT0606024.1 aryl-sulfate sulfotransferase [Croceitalea sp. F388]